MVSRLFRTNVHTVLDERLDFVFGEFLLAEFDRGIFKLVAESGRAEQDDAPRHAKYINANKNGLLRVDGLVSDDLHKWTEGGASRHSLSVHALALEERPQARVGEAVDLPQVAGGILIFGVRGALLVGKEAWRENVNNEMTSNFHFHFQGCSRRKR